ncbi:hypothetical protein U14_04686 [Candidatus Moduliflexus flocculans]|uniref:Uncharacterized protein n=1 Tax=Candidatus Moduliflexus flocculans TaxID=1499966 RepID=A0A0S6W0Z2_9BACT|nr:hypothetical protein U14_04686 [Candidatus Moduliflexus flocculans]
MSKILNIVPVISVLIMLGYSVIWLTILDLTETLVFICLEVVCFSD